VEGARAGGAEAEAARLGRILEGGLPDAAVVPGAGGGGGRLSGDRTLRPVEITRRGGEGTTLRAGVGVYWLDP
jgi:hypothetical protein